MRANGSEKSTVPTTQLPARIRPRCCPDRDSGWRWRHQRRQRAAKIVARAWELSSFSERPSFPRKELPMHPSAVRSGVIKAPVRSRRGHRSQLCRIGRPQRRRCSHPCDSSHSCHSLIRVAVRHHRLQVAAHGIGNPHDNAGCVEHPGGAREQIRELMVSTTQARGKALRMTSSE